MSRQVELDELARLLGRTAERWPAIQQEMLLTIGEMVLTEVETSIGTYQPASGLFEAWAELADSTKRIRVQLGYTENEPEHRSGDLEQSFHFNADGRSVAIGSDDPVAFEQEFGTSRLVARSIVGGALIRQLPAIQRMLLNHLAHAVTGGEVPLGLTVATDQVR